MNRENEKDIQIQFIGVRMWWCKRLKITKFWLYYSSLNSNLELASLVLKQFKWWSLKILCETLDFIKYIWANQSCKHLLNPYYLSSMVLSSGDKINKKRQNRKEGQGCLVVWSRDHTEKHVQNRSNSIAQFVPSIKEDAGRSLVLCPLAFQLEGTRG